MVGHTRQHNSRGSPISSPSTAQTLWSVVDNPVTFSQSYSMPPLTATPKYHPLVTTSQDRKTTRKQTRTYLVISANLANKYHPTLQSDGNTLPCSSSWFCINRLNLAKRLEILSNWPASSLVLNIRRYSLSSSATWRSMRWVRKSEPRTSTTRQA